MSAEKFIRGKVDSCHHDGRAANTRRLQQAEYHQANWQEEILPPEPVPAPEPVVMQPNRVYHLQNRNMLHGVFYHGTYYHRGVAQPHKAKK